MGKIKEALSLVKGGFAYILLFEDKLIAALDPNGFRPLSIGKNGKRSGGRFVRNLCF